MRKTNDITLKQAIDKLLAHYKLKGRYDETGVVHLWPELMGKAVANRTSQIYFYQHKLFVRIDSAVVKNDLLLMKSAIIDKLNERVGSPIVEDLVFL
jgi:predicted nucleic acid-binding Zn ribbon protein